jgi:hypothetical protein
MYRKRIGNVVFFPGVEHIGQAPRVSRTRLERKISHVASRNGKLATAIEEVIDDILAESDLEIRSRKVDEVIERLVDDILDELDEPHVGGVS